MGIKLISSENNAVIKHVRSLRLKKQRMKHLQFAIEGIRIIDEYLKYNGNIEYIIYSKDLHTVRGGADLLNKVSKRGFTIYEVPNKLFNKL